MPVIPMIGDWEADTVTIPVSEYITLLEENKFLRVLESRGLDSWDGYDDALKAWRSSE